MGRYILKRILLMIPVIVGVSFIIFTAMNLAQGDFVDTLNTEDMSAEAVEALREAYGLNKSLLEQYLDYMWNLLHGDLGTSFITGDSVAKLFFEKLPNTIYLGLVTSLIGTIVSIPLGIFAARNRGGIWDNIANVFADYLSRGLDDNGRFEIYKFGINKFSSILSYSL
jgi:peptide/nickel transport system permease protein